jgi:hypothetical protein
VMVTPNFAAAIDDGDTLYSVATPMLMLGVRSRCVIPSPTDDVSFVDSILTYARPVVSTSISKSEPKVSVRVGFTRPKVAEAPTDCFLPTFWWYESVRAVRFWRARERHGRDARTPHREEIQVSDKADGHMTTHDRADSEW